METSKPAWIALCLAVVLALWAAGCGDDVNPGSDPDAGALDTRLSDGGFDVAPDVADADPDPLADSEVPDVVSDLAGDSSPSPDVDATADSSADIALTDTDWGECSVDGRAGECITVESCDEGRVATPGFCPGPADIQCCTEPPETTCDASIEVIPSGSYVEAAGQQGCLAGMVRVDDDTCIDTFEAALEVRAADGSWSPWSPYFNPEGEFVRAVSAAGLVPQGYIDGDQAEAACTAAGKRLCTSAEWLRACQGPDGWTYPYGSTRLDGVCNDARAVHPAVETFGTSADWIWSELGNACINQLDASVDRTGANPQCVSAAGAFDMMGNLHEWTSDPSGTFRGGFYVDTVINGPGCLYATTAHNRSHWDYSTGFRCCADAL